MPSALPSLARHLPMLALAAASLISSGSAAPTSDREPTPRGQRIFDQRCATCHSTGERAAQGPGLGGVVGRKAASTRFAYSTALRESNLTWTPETLNRFLAAPSQLVAGTAMPMAVPDARERRDVVAYLESLGGGDEPMTTTDDDPMPAGPAAPELRTGREALGDFRRDGPGVRRHLVFSDLPAPFATPSAENSPEVVAAPQGMRPYLPPGFRADVFADGLVGPRLLRVSPRGDLFVAESRAGRIRVLRAESGARRADREEVYAAGLDRPFGIAFYPPGPRPQWLYVAETNAVVRYPYESGDLHARGPAQTVVASLTEAEGGHWTRDIAFSADSSRMFVSVGSASNVADNGADERDRADVLVFDPEGGHRAVFASGIRNCVGLAVSSPAGDVWCSTNERDGLGDDLVPDYVTRVRPGGFYGWPWYYLGAHQDPRHAGARPELAAQTIVPDVLLQAHSAPLQLAFYDASAFPPKYRERAFVALHGSWNRQKRTGPKVISIPIEAGIPNQEYEDFMTGFVATPDSVWARPVGVAVARDGALFVSEDANGTIWRVSWEGP